MIGDKRELKWYPALMANPDNFEQDVLPWMGGLYAMAWRTTGNSADAEDLVQDTLLKAYRSYKSFATDTNLRAWLFRIMTNTYISAYRKRQRGPQQIDIEQEDLEDRLEGENQALSSLGFTTSAERAALDKLVDQEIQQALDQLAEKYRLPVILSALGFSYSEMSDLLGVPLGTVMSRLHRGRTNLSEKLGDYVQRHRLLSDASPGS